jgi:hypothetical protein
MVKLTEHSGLSRETVRRRFLENDLKPWRKDMWCIHARLGHCPGHRSLACTVAIR